MALVALIRPPAAVFADNDRAPAKEDPSDFARAQEQHIDYGIALREAGAQFVALPSMDHCPDSVFVEDTALVVGPLAIVGHSGARERWVETPGVAAALSNYCYLIRLPEGATFEGGDALVIDRTVYIGHAQRTNMPAVRFLMTLHRQNGYQVIPVSVAECVQFKSAVSYLGNNTVLLNPAWVSRGEFAKYVQITVESTEPFAANALLAESRLFISARYPLTINQLIARRFNAQSIGISEFHKAEGRLTGLSILINTPNAH